MPNIAVIEIDSEVLKLIQAKSDSKGVFIEKVSVQPIRGLTQDECAAQINQLINKNAIKIDRLIAVISRKDLAIRMLQLPSTNTAELLQMVSLEAVKQIPFPSQDTIFDYRVMQTTEEGYSNIILAIAHKNAIYNIIDILTKSGLKPDILTLTTEGLFLWAQEVAGNDIETKRAVLIMNMDRNSVEMEIISGKRILLNRVSSFGASSLIASAPEQQKFKERLLLEVRRSIDAYNKEQKQNVPIEKLIITGSQEAAKSISGMFKDELGIDTAVVESAQAFQVDSRLLSAEALPKDISVSSALGAIFAQSAQALNILPQELKKKQELIQHGKKILTITVLAAALFVMVSAAIAINFYQRKATLHNLKVSVKKIAPVTKSLESKFEKLQMIKTHIESTKRSLIFLYELHKVIPENILLNYLSFDKKGRISLQGTTPAMPDVFKFVKMLEKSNKFKNVETPYVSKRSLRDRETVDFQITCELSV